MGIIDNIRQLYQRATTQPPLVNPQSPEQQERSWREMQSREKYGQGWFPGYDPAPTPIPTRIPVQGATPFFGQGQEPAYIEPTLYDALMAIDDPHERELLAELTGQESSYGWAGPHISEKEESYGPYHINLKAGRISPETEQHFTQQEAEDVNYSTEYALQELRRTGGLGAWNPGAYDWYQYGLPEQSKTKKYIKGKTKGV